MSPVRRIFRQLSIILTPLLLIASLVVMAGPVQVGASSHREAPLISSDPDADGTDFYMFVSPDRQDSVTLLASYIPFEAPEGGPNYNQFASDVLYEIHIDNVGDGKSHITYQFQFKDLPLRNPNTFLYNTGPIDSLDDPDWNIRQVYTLTEVVNGKASVLASDLPTPPSNIGSKSTPNYEALVNQALDRGVVNAGGDQIRVFAGQTDDAFWVDLGSIFDLLTLRGQQPPIGYSTGPTAGLDNLSGFNVHTLAIQVPISRLLASAPAGETVIGGWTTASRPTMTVRSDITSVLGGAATGQDVSSGGYVQLSRLGMPLTNEAVIPLALKDAFNNLKPELDAVLYTAPASDATLGPIGDLLQKSVEDPELGNLLCGLYKVPLPKDTNGDCKTEYDPNTPASGRADIFKIFLTGMTLTKPFTISTKGGAVTLPAGTVVNQPTKGSGIVPAEMLRLNTALKGDLCAPTPSRLGILGGDACGFPNGRRLGDEVVEIELLAVAGAAYSVLTPDSFNFNPALIGVLNDGVNGNDTPFLRTFPYIARPHQGQNHIHTNLSAAPTPQAAQPGSLPNTGTETGSADVYFPETGYRMSGSFANYWRTNGGLSVFGYPIAEAQPVDGTLTQWFERNRLELRPENAAPYNILLGRLGVEVLEKRGIDWQSLPTVASAPSGCRYFAETRHALCSAFLNYWNSNGLEIDGRRGTSYAESLALFGYPVSEPFEEVNTTTGQTYMVQYFERARFEYHPEASGTNKVMLGLLSHELGQ